MDPSNPIPGICEFANHYGFEIVACGVRKPNQKGRVENAVGYVKKNLLRGHSFTDFAQVNPAAREWLETLANQRIHGQTAQKPDELFLSEKDALIALPAIPYDPCVVETLRASTTFRIRLDTNQYSVPFRLAGQRVRVKKRTDQVLIYHEEQLVATHSRSYKRHQDIVDSDHTLPLLEKRRQAKEQRLLVDFLALCPEAAHYYEALKLRRLNVNTHVRKILALGELYKQEEIQRGIRDACEFKAFDSQYVLNIIQQRHRRPAEPGALHLTRREDMLELELPQPDLSPYDQDDLDTDEPTLNPTLKTPRK